MAQKRKAQQAFGKSQTGQLSAFAAARLAKQSKQDALHSNDTRIHSDDLVTEFAPMFDSAPESLDTIINSPPLDDEEAPVELAARSTSILPFSDFEARGGSHIYHKNGSCQLRLSGGSSVPVVGVYELRVVQGAVSVLGSLLQPQSGVQRVYAPSTHALPQILAVSNEAVLELLPAHSKLQKLGDLSPFFRNIWSGDKESNRTFAVLRSSADDALQRFLVPCEADRSYQTAIARLSGQSQATAQLTRVMAVGAKSSGKSTFNRILCNSILAKSQAPRCMYLDLDPGQPEFGPPGQVSLVEVLAPVLGPSFSHPASPVSQSYRTLRSHTIAATSFKEDSTHYMACAQDLARYIDKRLPLIVNSCGWVTGPGASVLLDLIAMLSITDIVVFDYIEAGLMHTLQSSFADATIHHIPRQPPRPSPRTPAETRAMQTMSYLHHRQASSAQSPRWSSKPLSSLRPWSVSYSGEDRGIHAVMSYGQVPSPQFLIEVLEGAIVALVAIDDGNMDEALAYHTASCTPAQSTDQAEPSAADLIHHTPEGLPYIKTNDHGYCIPPHPTHSQCVGLALIRGIDPTTKTIQLLTPLSESGIATLMTQKVILVRGSFDSPDFAYLEDVYSKDSGDGSETVTMDERPWVTKKDMVGVEGAVWRLRHPPLAVSHQMPR